MKKSRERIAHDLVDACPVEALDDHTTLAAAVLAGKPKDIILDMPECDAWPETYSWLKKVL